MGMGRRRDATTPRSPKLNLHVPIMARSHVLSGSGYNVLHDSGDERLAANIRPSEHSLAERCSHVLDRRTSDGGIRQTGADRQRVKTLEKSAIETWT